MKKRTNFLKDSGLDLVRISWPKRGYKRGTDGMYYALLTNKQADQALKRFDNEAFNTVGRMERS